MLLGGSYGAARSWKSEHFSREISARSLRARRSDRRSDHFCGSELAPHSRHPPGGNVGWARRAHVTYKTEHPRARDQLHPPTTTTNT